MHSNKDQKESIFSWWSADNFTLGHTFPASEIALVHLKSGIRWDLKGFRKERKKKKWHDPKQWVLLGFAPEAICNQDNVSCFRKKTNVFEFALLINVYPYNLLLKPHRSWLIFLKRLRFLNQVKTPRSRLKTFGYVLFFSPLFSVLMWDETRPVVFDILWSSAIYCRRKNLSASLTLPFSSNPDLSNRFPLSPWHSLHNPMAPSDTILKGTGTGWYEL